MADHTEIERPQPAGDRVRRTWIDSDRLLARLVVQPVRRFLQVEAAGGVLLLAAACAALVWANVAPHSYEHVWHQPLTVALGSWRFHDSLVHVINDGLMAVFFFVIGLEIKREWVVGELRDRRAAVLPVVAAIGGMVVPALLYLAFNAGTANAHGWGIPMATDIAFALGLVALLGSRVPNSVKIFLLTLAIVDDIGSMVVIAVFYAGAIDWGWLGAAAATVIVIASCKALHIRWHVLYVLLGLFLWLATYNSGLHATIAGVVLGLMTPAYPFQSDAASEVAVETIERHPGVTVEEVRRVWWLLRESVPVTDRLEDVLHPWTSFVIVPVFALANAGVEVVHGLSGSGARVLAGVTAGLVIGKLVGIFGASWITIRLGWGRLPSQSSWRELAAISAVAGIGFTMSLLIADLAFGTTASPTANHAKAGLLVASVLAAVLGTLLFRGRDSEELEARRNQSSEASSTR